MTDTDNSNPDDLLEDSPEQLADSASSDQSEEGDEEQKQEVQELQLDFTAEVRGVCQRHVTVTISREDVDRYLDKEYSELVRTAQVPGFRPGRAPRKLIEHRFRKQVTNQVKYALVSDALRQIFDEKRFVAIGEPELDVDALELSDDGPLVFEFDIEVRPEFELPNWKGLKIRTPVREITREDVDRALQRLLSERGTLTPVEGPAQGGDYVTANLTFKHGDRPIRVLKEQSFPIREKLTFHDGEILGLKSLLVGVRAGETRSAKATIASSAGDESLRGQMVDVLIEVLEVKKLELPEMTPELLSELGGFELEADLRDAVKEALESRLRYEQRQVARQQITELLTAAADWELPPKLLARQSRRELERAILDMQAAGFTEDEIKARVNFLRRNAEYVTARALKEHFILERIAEEEKIEATAEDYEEEIRRIAARSGQSPRRVRARLEKSDSMDVLHNQIIERKVVEKILEHAQFEPVPFEFPDPEEAALDASICYEEPDIPEAKPGPGEPAPSGRPETPLPRI